MRNRMTRKKDQHTRNTIRRRLTAVGLAAVLSASALACSGDAEATIARKLLKRDQSLEGSASGTFAKQGGSFAVADGFALHGASTFDTPVIEVHLVPMQLDRERMRQTIDFVIELDAQTEQSQLPGWAVLEIDTETGRWLGSRYGIPEGGGCAYCGTRKEQYLKLEGSRLTGVLELRPEDAEDGQGVAVDLKLDLPVAEVTGTSELSADGGEPGAALLGCWKAARSQDLEAVKRACYVPGDPALARLEHIREDARLDTLFWQRSQLRAEAFAISGGRTKGDQAEVFVSTQDAAEKFAGSMFLTRTGVGWRWAAQRMTPVWD